MLLVFVHGWSVTNTDTYGEFPEALAQAAIARELDIDIEHIWLGRYISFDDEIRMSDIVRAFDKAIRQQIPDNRQRQRPFSCVTHSTGGPVIREWLERYFGAKRLSQAPLNHLVMLAPANHGSPLAAIGKKRVGRIKAWFNGVEPGEKILTSLCLGSSEQWHLSERTLAYEPSEKGFYPFVLTGQSIDKKFYDFLNPYLKEVGSDGVVRVSGTNMNYSMLTLEESRSHNLVEVAEEPTRVQILTAKAGVKRPAETPLGVLKNVSHSGDRMGIMRSVSASDTNEPVAVSEVLNCLSVDSPSAYAAQSTHLRELTEATQNTDEKSKNQRYTAFVFRVREKDGTPVDDYDLYLLGKETFDPSELPTGFFVDRQRNDQHRNTIIYYVNFDVLMKIRGEGLGFRIVPRPSDESRTPVEERENFVYYRSVEFRMTPEVIDQTIRPNETLYVDIIVKRRVDKQVFRADPAAENRRDFKRIRPSGYDA